ncbi:MAG TPA: BMP family ABC transporter substrate-binding protein, partial [Lachnoclostridium sp.]|nr:BMP family ABC transporter substrate-binding protein [Lachnoclostridium sp.]
MKRTMKATALFLAAGLLLTACGGKTETAATTAAAGDAAGAETTAAAAETDAKKPSFVFVCTGQLGDKSFNDSANAGMEKIASDLGCEVKVIEIGRDQTKWEPT